MPRWRRRRNGAPAFDALFGAHFLGEMEMGDQLGEPDDETVRVQEERAGGAEPLLSDEVNEAGQDATAAEALSARRFGEESDFDMLRRFARAAPARMPRRAGYRRMRARRGTSFDTRRTLREAVRNDGDVMQLRRLKRRPRQRRVLLLIDVSGSMKERTETHLRIAHALAHARRAHRGLHLRHPAHPRDARDAAEAPRRRRWPRPPPSSATGTAARASATRCSAFLAVPRFAGYRARRRGAGPLRRAGARRPGRDARRRGAAVAARLARAAG